MDDPIRIIASLMCAATLAGCATVTSTPEVVTSPPSEGLVYYMPMRPIVVKITREAVVKKENDAKDGKSGKAVGDAPKENAESTSSESSKKPENDGGANRETTPSAPTPGPDKYKVEVAAGDAYADLSQRYVLKMPANAVAKRSIKIGVTPQGLLGSASAESNSQASEVLKALASAAGAMRPAALIEPKREEECQPGRAYTRMFHPEKAAGDTLQGSICGFQVTIERLGFSRASQTASGSAPGSSERASPNGKTGSSNGTTLTPSYATSNGIFYRQAFPYRVTVSDPKAGDSGPSTQFLVFSPSEAPVLFLPAKKSLFAADNKIDLQFADGVLTSYSQEIDGELVALLKLPADILSAYFEAIGSIFPKKTAALTTEKEYLDAMNALALARLQEHKCRDAIDEGDGAKIKEECGGEQ